MSQLPGTPDIDTLKVLVVMGGSLPQQNNACIRPVTGRVDSADRNSVGVQNQLVFEQAPQYPPDCDRALVYPCGSRFAVGCEALVGTVPEIVAHFEKELRAAVMSSYEGQIAIGADVAKTQEYLTKVSEVVGDIVIPWDFDAITGQRGVCAAAEQARKVFKLPTTEASDATTPSSDV